MTPIKKLLATGIIITVISCGENKKAQNTATGSTASEYYQDTTIVVTPAAPTRFPDEIDISDLKSTEFIFALEKKFSQNANGIYAPTLLMAWNELKQVYQTKKFIPNVTNADVDLLEKSQSHVGSLEKREYTLSITRSQNRAKVETYFEKSLPFENKMHVIDDFIFKGERVRAFGMLYGDMEVMAEVRVVYYKNDSDFIIKLLPKNDTTEIILIRGDHKSTNFEEVLTRYESKKKIGEADAKDKIRSWRSQLIQEDRISIPTFRFNIGKSYKDLLGMTYKDDHGLEHVLEVLYQRNAFVLNENGAEVESYAVAADSTAMVEVVQERPQPKKLYFNDDFYILLKKVNSRVPYFAVKVINAELMEKTGK